MDVLFSFLSKEKSIKKEKSRLRKELLKVVLRQGLCYPFLTMPHFFVYVRAVLLFKIKKATAATATAEWQLFRGLRPPSFIAVAILVWRRPKG
ncbi:hypothetical protein [Mucilaginibacter gynuensis]|uniref:hypothetical protein n=1 Tax=Mucilaginibacter gynuensis TaxID=1302236 RepID=UPI0031F0251F